MHRPVFPFPRYLPSQSLKDVRNLYFALSAIRISPSHYTGTKNKCCRVYFLEIPLNAGSFYKPTFCASDKTLPLFCSTRVEALKSSLYESRLSKILTRTQAGDSGSTATLLRMLEIKSPRAGVWGRCVQRKEDRDVSVRNTSFRAMNSLQFLFLQ